MTGAVQRGAALAALLVLGLVGCARNNPTPTPPIVTVAQANNALAQALDVATTAIVAANRNGQLPDATVRDCFNVTKRIETAVPKVAAALAGVGTWPQKRLALAGIVAEAGVEPLLTKLPPTAQSILSNVLALWSQITQGVK